MANNTAAVQLEIGIGSQDAEKALMKLEKLMDGVVQSTDGIGNQEALHNMAKDLKADIAALEQLGKVGKSTAAQLSRLSQVEALMKSIGHYNELIKGTELIPIEFVPTLNKQKIDMNGIHKEIGRLMSVIETDIDIKFGFDQQTLKAESDRLKKEFNSAVESFKNNATPQGFEDILSQALKGGTLKSIIGGKSKITSFSDNDAYSDILKNENFLKAILENEEILKKFNITAKNTEQLIGRIQELYKSYANDTSTFVGYKEIIRDDINNLVNGGKSNGFKNMRKTIKEIQQLGLANNNIDTIKTKLENDIQSLVSDFNSQYNKKSNNKTWVIEHIGEIENLIEKYKQFADVNDDIRKRLNIGAETNYGSEIRKIRTDMSNIIEQGGFNGASDAREEYYTAYKTMFDEIQNKDEAISNLDADDLPNLAHTLVIYDELIKKVEIFLHLSRKAQRDGNNSINMSLGSSGYNSFTPLNELKQEREQIFSKIMEQVASFEDSEKAAINAAKKITQAQNKIAKKASDTSKANGTGLYGDGIGIGDGFGNGKGDGNGTGSGTSDKDAVSSEEFDKWQLQLKDLQEKINSFSERLQKLESEQPDGNTTDIQPIITTINSLVDTINHMPANKINIAELEKASTALSGLQTVVDKLKDLDSLKTSLSDVSTEIVSISNNINTLINQFATLEQKIIDIPENLKTLQISNPPSIDVKPIETEPVVEDTAKVVPDISSEIDKETAEIKASTQALKSAEAEIQNDIQTKTENKDAYKETAEYKELIELVNEYNKVKATQYKKGDFDGIINKYTRLNAIIAEIVNKLENTSIGDLTKEQLSELSLTRNHGNVTVYDLLGQQDEMSAAHDEKITKLQQQKERYNEVVKEMGHAEKTINDYEKHIKDTISKQITARNFKSVKEELHSYSTSLEKLSAQYNAMSGHDLFNPDVARQIETVRSKVFDLYADLNEFTKFSGNETQIQDVVNKYLGVDKQQVSKNIIDNDVVKTSSQLHTDNAAQTNQEVDALANLEKALLSARTAYANFVTGGFQAEANYVKSKDILIDTTRQLKNEFESFKNSPLGNDDAVSKNVEYAISRISELLSKIDSIKINKGDSKQEIANKLTVLDSYKQEAEELRILIKLRNEYADAVKYNRKNDLANYAQLMSKYKQWFPIQPKPQSEKVADTIQSPISNVSTGGFQQSAQSEIDSINAINVAVQGLTQQIDNKTASINAEAEAMKIAAQKEIDAVNSVSVAVQGLNQQMQDKAATTNDNTGKNIIPLQLPPVEITPIINTEALNNLKVQISNGLNNVEIKSFTVATPTQNLPEISLPITADENSVSNIILRIRELLQQEQSILVPVAIDTSIMKQNITDAIDNLSVDVSHLKLNITDNNITQNIKKKINDELSQVEIPVNLQPNINKIRKYIRDGLKQSPIENVNVNKFTISTESINDLKASIETGLTNVKIQSFSIADQAKETIRNELSDVFKGIGLQFDVSKLKTEIAAAVQEATKKAAGDQSKNIVTKQQNFEAQKQLADIAMKEIRQAKNIGYNRKYKDEMNRYLTQLNEQKQKYFNVDKNNIGAMDKWNQKTKDILNNWQKISIEMKKAQQFRGDFAPTPVQSPVLDFSDDNARRAYSYEQKGKIDSLREGVSLTIEQAQKVVAIYDTIIAKLKEIGQFNDSENDKRLQDLEEEKQKYTEMLTMIKNAQNNKGIFDLSRLNKIITTLDKLEANMSVKNNSAMLGSIAALRADITQAQDTANNNEIGELNVDELTNYTKLLNGIDEAFKNIKTKSDEIRINDNMINATNKLDTKFNDLIVKAKQFAEQNSRIKGDKSVLSQYNEIIKRAQSLPRTAENFQQLSREFNNFKAAVMSKGLTGRSIGEELRFIAEKIGVKAMLGNQIYRIIGWFRQMVTVVRELDTEMTSLKRVTNETEAAYNTFLKSATKTAKELGATITATVNATAEFSKLGYNLQEATSLGQSAIIYGNVGLMETSVAIEALSSTIQAFKLNANESMAVVDKMNEIGNNYAISSQGVGEALQRSASSLVAAGNDLDESIALITAGDIIA